MWKREDQPAASPTPESTPRTDPPRAAASSRERATIGPSISIRGDVTGDEDLLIQGQVDGSVSLQSHSVTVGREGRVQASITGRVITVEGHVEGDLTAEEQVVLRGTARVQGDVKAPRVVLEDGASFRGLVDMGTPAAAATGGRHEETSRSEKSRGGGGSRESESASGTSAGSGAGASASGGAGSRAGGGATGAGGGAAGGGTSASATSASAARGQGGAPPTGGSGKHGGAADSRGKPKS